MHTDHLGSTEATTNALGQFVNRMSFGAWGERQQHDWKPGTPTETFLTTNGFTGHDQLDNHNLVHMGGRVYDPNLGRFLSADIVVQSPYDSQSVKSEDSGEFSPDFQNEGAASSRKKVAQEMKKIVTQENPNVKFEFKDRYHVKVTDANGKVVKTHEVKNVQKLVPIFKKALNNPNYNIAFLHGITTIQPGRAYGGGC